jgi:hypothetical protein
MAMGWLWVLNRFKLQHEFVSWFSVLGLENKHNNNKTAEFFTIKQQWINNTEYFGFSFDLQG